MFRMGTVELVILLVIILLLFGVGRISKIAGELGKGITAFRAGLKSEDETKEEEKTEKKD